MPSVPDWKLSLMNLVPRAATCSTEATSTRIPITLSAMLCSVLALSLFNSHRIPQNYVCINSQGDISFSRLDIGLELAVGAHFILFFDSRPMLYHWIVCKLFYWCTHSKEIDRKKQYVYLPGIGIHF